MSDVVRPGEAAAIEAQLRSVHSTVTAGRKPYCRACGTEPPCLVIRALAAVRAEHGEKIAQAIEARRAPARVGEPGYAVGNATFNEGLDAAARLAREASE